MQFRTLTAEELHFLAPIFDSENQITQYHDDNKGQMVSMQTYSGDWKITNKRLGKAEGIKISFIAVERRF